MFIAFATIAREGPEVNGRSRWENTGGDNHRAWERAGSACIPRPANAERNRHILQNLVLIERGVFLNEFLFFLRHIFESMN
jgi:hypothetical protein